MKNNIMYIGILLLFISGIQATEKNETIKKTAKNMVYPRKLEVTLAIVRDFIESGGSPDALSGGSPLIIFATGEESLMQYLIDQGAYIDARGFGGTTPLIWAAENAELGVVRMLIKAGANINAQDYSGRTPLMLAIYHAEKPEKIAAVIAALLENGADINIKDKSGKTVFDYAKEEGHSQVLADAIEYRKRSRNKQRESEIMTEELSKNQAKETKRQAETRKMTFSHDLHKNTSLENVKKFIEKENGSPDARDGDEGKGKGMPLLSIAAARNTENVIQYLIDNGANLEILDPGQRTPLMNAAMHGQPSAVRILAKARANVNIQTASGKTPLMLAVYYAQKPEKIAEVIAALLENGADINIKDKSGKTVFDYAKEKSRTKELEEGIDKDKSFRALTTIAEEE